MPVSRDLLIPGLVVAGVVGWQAQQGTLGAETIAAVVVFLVVALVVSLAVRRLSRRGPDDGA